jgi:transcriptional regulator with XRE-family HTH domain
MSLEVASDELAAFARRLRTARQRIFKTRAALARASGIEADTIRTYENGRNYPHNQALKRLMVALGVTSDWLLYGETAGLSINRLRLLEGERSMRTA